MDNDVIAFRDDDVDLSNHSTMATPVVRLPFDGQTQGLRAEFIHPLVQAMYDRHIAIVHDKIEFLASQVGDRTASLQMHPPIVRFASDQYWHVQIVGFETTRTSAWMWAWADRANEIPPANLAAVNQLRDFGRRKQIPELTATAVLPGPVTPALLCTLACGVSGASAYHRVEIPGGAVYVLICDPSYPPNIVDPIERIADVFPKVATQYACNNREAFVAYARHFGLEPQPDNGGIIVRDNCGGSVHAVFDRLGRMSNMKLFRAGA